MKSGKNALVEPSLGLLLSADPVADKDLLGKNNLFYGLARFQGGQQQHAYIKVLPPKRMYAEVLCSTIGRALGLPMAYTALLVARGSMVGINADRVICLASVDTAAMPISRIVRQDEIADKLNKWAHIRTAIVFDELVANADRHLRNVLLGADGKLWLIDHEEAIDEPLSAPHRAICNHLLIKMIEDLGDFERRRSGQMLGEKVLPVAEYNFALHAENSLPGPCQVSAQHVREVVEFLQARVHHIPNLLDTGLALKQRKLDLAP